MQEALLLHGQIGRTFEPHVFASRPHLIPTPAEFFVPLSPHLVNPISQMLGDMKSVKADLLFGMGKACLRRMNLRRPPIHLRIPCNWADDHCGYQPIRILFSRPIPTYSAISALDPIVRYLWYETSSTQRLGIRPRIPYNFIFFECHSYVNTLTLRASFHPATSSQGGGMLGTRKPSVARLI